MFNAAFAGKLLCLLPRHDGQTKDYGRKARRCSGANGRDSITRLPAGARWPTVYIPRDSVSVEGFQPTLEDEAKGNRADPILIVVNDALLLRLFLGCFLVKAWYDGQKLSKRRKPDVLFPWTTTNAKL